MLLVVVPSRADGKTEGSPVPPVKLAGNSRQQCCWSQRLSEKGEGEMKRGEEWNERREEKERVRKRDERGKTRMKEGKRDKKD